MDAAREAEGQARFDAAFGGLMTAAHLAKFLGCTTVMVNKLHKSGLIAPALGYENPPRYDVNQVIRDLAARTRR